MVRRTTYSLCSTTLHDYRFLVPFLGKDANKNASAEGPKAGADIGKIVNMMAGDAGRVSAYFVDLTVIIVEDYSRLMS